MNFQLWTTDKKSNIYKKSYYDISLYTHSIYLLLQIYIQYTNTFRERHSESLHSCCLLR